MKKIVSLLVALVMVFGLTANVAFASPRSDVLDALSGTVIGKHDIQMQQIRNILGQVEISEAQAKELIAYIEEGAAVVTEDKGSSIHHYSDEEQELAMELFDKACKVLNLTYKVSPKKNSVHPGDITFDIYDASGKLLGVLDGDGKTDAISTNSAVYYIGGAVVLVIAAAAVLVIRKRQAN